MPPRIIVLLVMILGVSRIAGQPGGSPEEGPILFGYDCADERVNVTKISLTQVGPCPDPKMIGNPRQVSIQVLRQPTFTSVKVQTCALVVNQLRYYCGMHSHASLAHQYEYVHTFSRAECSRLQDHGEFVAYNQTFTKIPRNSLHYHVNGWGHRRRLRWLLYTRQLY